MPAHTTIRHARAALRASLRASLLVSLAAVAATACRPASGASADAADASGAADSADAANATVYGAATTVGAGTARVYITRRDGAPTEIGVALSEAALRGLPGPHERGTMTMPDGHTMFEHPLAMPADNPTPFAHVVLNWNPGGHEPPGIYDRPHFDFHFYTIDAAAWTRMDPAVDPEFERKALRQPAAELIPQGYIMPAPLAIPRMGVHWVDPTSPELNGETFTRTFIFGSYDGQVIFAEPMITKAFLESKPQFAAPLPPAARYEREGYQPDGWAVRWDEASGEYRIALTGLTLRR